MTSVHIYTAAEHPFAQYVRILGKGKKGTRSLSFDEAVDAMTMILNGTAEPVQIGAFLMLLRVKEESPEEIAGFVTAARRHIGPPEPATAIDLDWSSYAGKRRQLPWFLLAVLALADQGVRIFMHGASGHTSGRLYTENVLAQLGMPLAASWRDAAQHVAQHNFAYMPLATLCPALHGVIELRNVLGLRSPVHTLARLLNPLSAPYSMQSIFHPAYGDIHQRAAQLLGQPFAAVFKGEGGEVEYRPNADVTVKAVGNGTLSEEKWPRMTQDTPAVCEHLDARYLVGVWRGELKDEYGYQAIVGTAAIALKMMGKAPDREQALALADIYWRERNKARL